jgi:hypothetical protein
LNVVNLVHAGVHAVIDIHPLRDVPGDRHSVLMGFVTNRFHHLGLKGTVKLHLLESGVVIRLHPLRGICRRVHAFDAQRDRTVPVHDPGQQHVWSEALS